MGLDRVVTVIVHKDGRHHATTENCTPEDAQRWTDEGYHVFQLATRRAQWAILHVNSNRVMTSGDQVGGRSAEGSHMAIGLLTNKGEG